MPPTLSLCVPTYNRAALLSQSLRAILAQITPEMRQDVEVVVLDNASPDDTPQVVAQAQADFPHVTLNYVRRPQNVGCDANFCDAPNRARGVFVYLLSDDDVLLPGAVPKLLALIQEHPDLDAFALNVREFRKDALQEANTPVAFTLPKDVLCTDRDQALSLLKVHVTFISCIAFRGDNVRGRDYSARYATNLAQAYMFLDALAPGRGTYAVAQPYLARREDNNEGFGFFKVFVTNFHALMAYARQSGYAEETVQGVLRHDLDYVYHCLLIFKASGRYGNLRLTYLGSLRAVVRLLRAFGLNRFVLTRMIPRLLVPSAVFGRLQRLYGRAKAGRGGLSQAQREG